MTINVRRFFNLKVTAKIFLGTWALILWLGHPFAHAQTERAQEYALKAAFMVNFAKFVEWPDSAMANWGEKFVLCVIGEDAFGSILDGLSKQAVKGKPVQIKRLEDLPEQTDCIILFVSDSERHRMAHIMQRLQGKNVLLIGDYDGFLAEGGMIQFFKEQNKIRFAINIQAARQADLSISSKLLKLAKIVRE